MGAQALPPTALHELSKLPLQSLDSLPHLRYEGPTMLLDPELTAQLKRVLSSIEPLLPPPIAPVDWSLCQAATWHRSAYSASLQAVTSTQKLLLDDLLGIDRQKKLLEDNTRQFLAGLPANHALLWGTRGTGKSSLVRALLSTYATQGLRLVQVDKADLVSLPAIGDALKLLPYKFILFSDDLSFEPGDGSYKVLKSTLDGATYALPPNALIYVTSNRRHLLPEYESDNRGAMMVEGEIHHGEAIEEKISLSGRFGLWIDFHSFSQELFLHVVRRWVEKLEAPFDVQLPWTKDAEREAVAWSQKKGDRSGRIAYQFACDWVGRTILAQTVSP